MKSRKLLVLGLILLLSMSFSACSNDNTSSKEEVESREIDIDENSNKESSEQEKSSKENQALVIAAGDPVTIENVCDFYIDYVDISNEVKPPSPGSWYSHYKADDGKSYVDICLAYKNLLSGSIKADETINATLVYDGKYEYTGFSIIEEDNRSDFTYSNITSIAPLTTEYMHYLFLVPEKVQNSKNSIEVNMKIAGNDYKVIVREGSGEVEASEESSQASSKKSGQVSDGEGIVTEKAAFYVNYSNITNDVIPPNPGDWYSHYEADAGKAFVDFCIAYKNTSSSNVRADSVISANMKYAGKYDYTGFSIIEEDNRSDFTYSNITSIAPLTTEYIHYLFEIPEDVVNSSETIEITFSIDGNQYVYSVR